MVLDDREWSHKAWMSRIDADLFERIIFHQAEHATSLQVLEWGAGRSTLYFTEHFRQQGFDLHWTSIEYDRGYFREELEPQLIKRQGIRIHLYEEDQDVHVSKGGSAEPSLDLVLFDKGKLSPFLEDHKADRLVNMDDYVAYPGTLGKRFDVIVVDARKRRRCLIEAASLLNPRGVAILHDAYRPYYHCAFRNFRSHRMLGEVLWVGSQAETNFLEWIL